MAFGWAHLAPTSALSLVTLTVTTTVALVYAVCLNVAFLKSRLKTPFIRFLLSQDPQQKHSNIKNKKRKDVMIEMLSAV